MKAKSLLTFFLSTFSSLLFAQNSFEDGVKQFNNGKYKAAETSFKKYLDNHKNDKKAQEYLGDIAFKLKDWNTAIDYYKPLLKNDQNNAIYHFKYGSALGKKAKEINRIRAVFLLDDIKESFKKAAELDPDYEEVRMALVKLYVRLPGALGGDLDTAKIYADQLKKINANKGKEAHQIIAAAE